MPYRLALVGLLLVNSVLPGLTVGQRYGHNSYVGSRPPELVSQRADWLGRQGPTTLDQLKGKVTWLQFNFCENCTSLRYHLVRWENKYAQQGLVVIEINQSIGAPREKMRRMVESQRLQHRVLWDEDCQNTRAYGISTWPFAYLIGPDGKVFWEGNPSRWIRRAEKADTLRLLIERKLGEGTRVAGKPSPPH